MFTSILEHKKDIINNTSNKTYTHIDSLGRSHARSLIAGSNIHEIPQTQVVSCLSRFPYPDSYLIKSLLPFFHKTPEDQHSFSVLRPSHNRYTDCTYSYIH